MLLHIIRLQFDHVNRTRYIPERMSSNLLFVVCASDPFRELAQSYPMERVKIMY